MTPPFVRTDSDITFSKNVQTLQCLVVDFELAEECIYLKIINIAGIPLLNVEISFDVPLMALSGTKNIQQLHILKSPYYAPGKQIRIFLDPVATFFHFQEQLQIKITVSFAFEVSGKKPETGKYVIQHDLDTLRGLPQGSSIII